MLISDPKLKELYQEICDEHNASSLATDEGYYHRPNDFTLLQLREVVRKLPDGQSVFLDIGTGSGIVPRVVRRLGARSITVDWPVTGSQKAVISACEAGVEGYYCQVGEDPLPVEDGSVDCVLLADVLEHLLHSPRPVLADMSRVLKRGGVCIATTPNALRAAVRIKVPLGYSNWPYVFDYYDASFHGGHHHEYTIDEFRGIFQRAGFAEEALSLHEARLGHVPIVQFGDIRTRSRKVTLVSVPMPWFLRLASHALGLVTRLWPRLRSEMMIVVRKP